MSGRRGTQERRASMWKHNPHCYWCGVLTVQPEPSHYKRPPDNQATVDHLRPRTHPRRREVPRSKERRLVLACRKCNFERNRVEHDGLPVEVRRELTERGKNGARRPWKIRAKSAPSAPPGPP